MKTLQQPKSDTRRSAYGIAALWMTVCTTLAAVVAYPVFVPTPSEAKANNPRHAVTQTASVDNSASLSPVGLTDPAKVAPPTLRYFAKAIESFRVGDSVAADNPTGERDDSLGETIEPAKWRKLTLRAPKTDGSWADVTLLRPTSWLEEHHAQAGGTVQIKVPECGIDGHAQLLAIEPCPEIVTLPGCRTVTGVFKHQSARIVDVHVSGHGSPIGATGNHPFWSEDRQDFIRADSLTPGETLRGLDGPLTVTQIIPRSAPEPVYNLEVHLDHVYHVSDAGILVHNSDPCPDELGKFSGNTTSNNELIHGTGNAPGIFEIGARAKSTAFVRQLLSDGKLREFVYLPDEGIFAINKRLDYRGTGPRFPGSDGSPHSTIRSTLPKTKNVVGGNIRLQKGIYVTDELSGHYGRNWTDQIRAKFRQFMEKQGFEVAHDAF